MSTARTMRIASGAPHAAIGDKNVLRSVDLSIGTLVLGVDGFVLSGLLPQVATSLHVTPGEIVIGSSGKDASPANAQTQRSLP